ncbi:MAG: alpha/beta fold hydrolase [Acidobacteriota bacterium]
MNPERPRLLLLHGFTGDGGSWNGVRERLGPALDVCAPDLPGHGGALEAGDPADLPPSFEAMVDLLAEHLGADGAAMAGYSLGARLALGLAVRHPDRVRSLVLVGVRPGLDPEQRAGRAGADDALARRLETEGLEAFIDRWEHLPLFATQRRLPAVHQEDQRRRRLAKDPGGLAWALRVLSPGRMPDLRPALGGLPMPVQLLVGEEDRTFLGLARAMERALPRAEVTAVPGCGHNLLLEAPGAVASACRRAAEGHGVLQDSSTAPLGAVR